MKTRRQIRAQLGRIYDILFQQAEYIVRVEKPCEIKKRGATVTCVGCRVGNDKPNVLCCIGCQWHDHAKGCQADKPLTCKAWLCSVAKDRHPETRERLRRLNQRIMKLKFWVCRGDKRQSIDQAMRERGFKTKRKLTLLELIGY